MERKEFCNPIDLAYKFQHYEEFAHREGADPTLILFKDTYYLFVSMSAGFYYSDDMVSWKWCENRDIDIYRYAPDVEVIGGYLYFIASTFTGTSKIWRSADPLNDGFELVSEFFPVWDPDLFLDDDGRLYLYWGCSDKTPIYGCEMDLNTMKPKGDPVALIFGEPDAHGWERMYYPGRTAFIPDDKTPEELRNIAPFIEGAYMTKYNDKYYLQYAAPGTEIPVYGDGVYVSDSPLGPFDFMNNSPFSYKPGGFAVGAGHGSTLKDKNGQWWHAATIQISLNARFERRVGIWPVYWDQDGVMHCDQHFGDYPLVLTDSGYTQPYVSVSYKKKATSSSVYANNLAENAVDENSKSFWCAESSENEWLLLDLQKCYDVHSIQINFADVEIPVIETTDTEKYGRYIDSSYGEACRWVLEGSEDGENYLTLIENTEADFPKSNFYHIFDQDLRLRYLKVTSYETPYNSRFAISGLRVFGLPVGPPPTQVDDFDHEFEDERRSVRVTWKPSNDAHGYSVKYGLAPDKLYSSYQVYESTKVLITSLNKDCDYYIRIDSFGEGGVTKGKCSPLMDNNR